MEPACSNFTVTGGIRFETLVPERVLIIPNQDNIKNRVEFGIKVTNQTSTPYRFAFVSLVPELVGPEGEAIQFDYGINSVKATSASDCLLAKPGESLTFFTKAKFRWGINTLRICGRDLLNGCWCFTGLRSVRLCLFWAWCLPAVFSKGIGRKRFSSSESRQPSFFPMPCGACGRETGHGGHGFSCRSRPT